MWFLLPLDPWYLICILGKGYVFYGLIRHSNNWAEQFLKQIERLRR